MTDRQKSLLLVEDEALLALVEKKQLEQLGYKMHHVYTGEAAIALVADSEVSIDLILMDIDLGRGIDGTTAAERILEQRELPVVFLSSHTEPEVVEKTEKITSYGYVVKNSGLTVLDASIKMAFRLFEARMKEKKHRHSLFISEEKYRMILKNSPDIILLQHPDGSVDYVSPQAQDILGFSPKEVRDFDVLDHIHPEDIPLIMGAMEKTFQRRENAEISYRFIHRDGRTIWLEHKGGPVYFDDEFSGVQSTIRDISDWKRAQEKLRLQSQVLDQIHDHVTITDLEGVILYVNKAELETFTRPADEIVGRSTEVYGEDAERGATQREIVETTLREGSWRGEVVNFEADGTEHVMDARTRAVLDDKGRPIALCGIATDVTGYRKMLKDLSRSKQLYESLFTNNPYGIVLLDPENGSFVEFNDQVCAQLGYDREEFARLSLFDIESKETADEVRQHIENILALGYDRFETFQRTKDGEARPVEVTARMLYIGENPVHFCIWRDITDEKPVEDQLGI